MSLNKNLAPVCLFCFNRPDLLKQTLKALESNYLADQTTLYIFSDGARNEKDNSAVKAVRDFINSNNFNFQKVVISTSEKNKGLANSIINGVDQVIQKHERVIVLEDDLVTSHNFLNFMNQALDFYMGIDKAFSISGYTMDLPGLKGFYKDYYLGYRASSWGWGTWKDRWMNMDWEMKGFKLLTWKEKRAFRKGGNDLPRMLNHQLKGRIDSWAIRWVYHQFKIGGLTIFPKISKVISLGIGEDATHTKKTTRFETVLDSGVQIDFEFDDELTLNPILLKDFKNKFSILNRLRDRF